MSNKVPSFGGIPDDQLATLDENSVMHISNFQACDPEELMLWIGENLRFPETLDATAMATAGCDQRFFCEEILRLTSPHKSVDLHAGGAVAAALECIRTEFYCNGMNLATSLERGFKAFSSFWGAYETRETDKKDFVNTWGAIESYFEQYPPQVDTIRPYIKADGKPAVEFTFSLSLDIQHPDYPTGHDIPYSGRFDMLGVREDGLVVLDDKTTSQISESWMKQWRMRGQFIGYVAGAQMNGFDCSNAVVRGVAILKTTYNHIEVPLQISNWMIERWYHATTLRARNLVDKYKQTRDIAENWIAYKWSAEEALWQIHRLWNYSFGEMCTSYRGCTFIDLCTVQKPWEYYNTFGERKWNPLEKNPDKSPAKFAGMDSVGLSEFFEE